MAEQPPTIDLPENATAAELEAAGECFGQWYGECAVRLVKEAERLNTLTEEANQIILNAVVKDMCGSENDLSQAMKLTDNMAEAFARGQLRGFKRAIEVAKLLLPRDVVP